MKFLVALTLLVAAAVAVPVGPTTGDKDARIDEQHNTNIGLESYDTSYATSNGISHQEQGALKNVGTENEAIEVRGQYQYTGDDGVVYTLTYVANENGFQPNAPYLPQAP